MLVSVLICDLDFVVHFRPYFWLLTTPCIWIWYKHDIDDWCCDAIDMVLMMIVRSCQNNFEMVLLCRWWWDVVVNVVRYYWWCKRDDKLDDTYILHAWIHHMQLNVHIYIYVHVYLYTYIGINLVEKFR